MKKKTIYLPIEIKARELDSFILIAKFAVQNDYRVYIGSKFAINRLLDKKKSYGGLFVFKGGLPLENIKEIRKKVDHFLILDQEISPSCLDFKKEIRKRVWPGSEKLIDKYYVLGNKALEVSKEVLKEMSPNIIKTGWPTIDLFRKEFKFLYEKKVREIRGRYGDFILFSSAFGFNSKKIINDFYEIKKKSAWDSVKNDLDEIMKWAELSLKEFHANIDLFKKIDKDKSCPQIIIRPHPAEDHMEWNKIAKNFDNIKVIYEGSIIPWIYAAKALLHRGCASSVQAYMAGIPIGYPILKKDSIKRALPYDISECLYNFEDILDFCKKNINSVSKYKKNFSESFCHMIDYEDTNYACEKIIGDFNKLNTLKEEAYKPSIFDKTYDIFDKLSKIYNKNVNFFYKSNINIGQSTPSQKMQGGINKKEIEDQISLMDKKYDFKVKSVFTDCVEIN